jgi:phosphate transport system substrate-binding protein
MFKKTLLAASATLLLLSSTSAFARDQIHAVGSSTVYPFATVVAEKFGKGSFKTPVIESTGTGGGFKLFCAGAGDDTPDFSDASRAIKSSEVDLCKKNGVASPIEIKIGYDGIVFANAAKAPKANLTREQIFLALARQVPVNGKLVDNPYKNWSEIDKSLPNEPIEVYGPPPTSGTRDAFGELVMVKGCEKFKEFEAAYPDEKDREKVCAALREDGKYIEAGENDNLIVQKLASNPKAFGIFGYSYLDQNADKIKGASIDGTPPTFDNISSGTYKVSRPLFVYVKREHLGKIPGMKEYVKEFVSTKAIGEEGYLSAKGLIPMHADELKKVQSIDIK